MIDIHTHILWGLDDGAHACSDSLAMLEMAAGSGTTDIVATPHSDMRFKFTPELVQERIAHLKAASGGAPKIHSGCDFHLSLENIEEALVFPRKFTIDGRGYLLVELSDAFIPRSMDGVLQRFVGRGIAPVITHPERNPLLREDVSRLRKWVGLGCAVQITAQSLSGDFGGRAKASAWRMLKKSLVHVVASDAHDVTNRPPRLDIARNVLTQEIGAQAARLLLVENPAAILIGASIVPATPSKRWYSF